MELIQQVAVHLGVARLELQRPAARDNGLIGLPQVPEGDAQITVCRGQVGLQLYPARKLATASSNLP